MKKFHPMREEFHPRKTQVASLSNCVIKLYIKGVFG
jgi:hypothetical protein